MSHTLRHTQRIRTLALSAGVMLGMAATTFGPQFAHAAEVKKTKRTLAEKIAVPVAQLAPKPAHLSWEEAAALPLALRAVCDSPIAARQGGSRDLDFPRLPRHRRAP